MIRHWEKPINSGAHFEFGVTMKYNYDDVSNQAGVEVGNIY